MSMLASSNSDQVLDQEVSSHALLEVVAASVSCKISCKDGLIEHCEMMTMIMCLLCIFDLAKFSCCYLHNVILASLLEKIRSFNHASAPSSMHEFIHPCIQSFVHAFNHSFRGWLAGHRAPDAFEMMASSPPGGFAPGGNSPFLPAFRQAAPPSQPPAPSSSHTMYDTHIPISPSVSSQPGGRFSPERCSDRSASGSHRPHGGLSPANPLQQASSASPPSSQQRQLHHLSPPLEQRLQEPHLSSNSLASPGHKPDGIFGGGMFGASTGSGPHAPSRSPTGYKSPISQSYETNDGAGSFLGSSASAADVPNASSNAFGAQQQQDKAGAPWQPQVAATGPSWLQPATWQAAGGAGPSWLLPPSTAPQHR